MEPFTMLALAGAALAAIAVVTITIKVIKSWVEKIFSQRSWFFWKKNREVHLIREALGKGKYAVVGGVFNRDGDLTETRRWQGKLDSDLSSAFGNRNAIIMENV